jgi:Heavy metal binding domain
MKYAFFALALTAIFASCEPAAEAPAPAPAVEITTPVPAADASTTTTAAASTVVAATYSCPMKCEGNVALAAPGKCSKCKMDLVADVAK